MLGELAQGLCTTRANALFCSATAFIILAGENEKALFTLLVPLLFVLAAVMILASRLLSSGSGVAEAVPVCVAPHSATTVDIWLVLLENGGGGSGSGGWGVECVGTIAAN